MMKVAIKTYASDTCYWTGPDEKTKRRWARLMNNIRSKKKIRWIRTMHDRTFRKLVVRAFRTIVLCRKSLYRIKLRTRMFNMRFHGRFRLNL